MYRYIISFFLIITLNPESFLSQTNPNYLEPYSVTIASNGQAVITGRLKIIGVTETAGAAARYSAKLHISPRSSDPRISATIFINAVYDTDVDGADQYKATITNIPAGSYYFCYGYYLDNLAYTYGGRAIDDGMFHVGSLTVTSASDIKTEEAVIPSTPFLYQNYPNPFNPATIIKYYIPQSDYVKLELFDSIGRSLATLINEKQSSGFHTFELNCSKYTAGVYYYSLRAGAFRSHRKFVLLK